MANDQVQQHRQVAKIILSTGVGAFCAGFAAPVIYGSLVVSYSALVAAFGSSIGAGAVGGAMARVTHNVSDADPIQYIETCPSEAQTTFRDALLQGLDSELNGIINSIRRNRDSAVNDVLRLNSNTNAAFKPFDDVWAGGLQYELVLRYKIKVESQPNTAPRDLEQGVEPRPLPVHIGSRRTKRYVLPHASPGFFNGVVQNTAAGALLGGVFGGAGVTFLPQAAHGFHFFHTVPNSNMGVVLGMPTAAGATGTATQMMGGLDMQDNITQMILLFVEMKKHFIRLMDCAEMNDVKIKVEAVCGYRPVANINTPALTIKSDMGSCFIFDRTSG